MSGVADIAFDGYRPGALGRVCAMQIDYYARDWGFGLAFETRVAAEMAEFLCRQNPARDLFRVAVRHAAIVGSVTVDGGAPASELAHLRWFITDDATRGTGLGRWLLDEAVAFARRAGYRGMYLWTFDGLAPARHLYERVGFRLTDSFRADGWGVEVEEQRFELLFGA